MTPIVGWGTGSNSKALVIAFTLILLPVRNTSLDGGEKREESRGELIMFIDVRVLSLKESASVLKDLFASKGMGVGGRERA